MEIKLNSFQISVFPYTLKIFSLLVFLAAFATNPVYGSSDILVASIAYASASNEMATQVSNSAEAKSEETAEATDFWKPMPVPKLEKMNYPVIKGFNSRLSIWIVAQLHLFFAAFVLGVPIYVWVIELIGVRTKDPRYDRISHEFMKVALTGFSLAASFGGLLIIMLVVFYPDFMKYMASIFGKMMIYYAFLFFAESFLLYTYYYGWDWMNDGGVLKKIHLLLGLGLNGSGMALMVTANAWGTFMMAPTGISEDGTFLGDIWAVIKGPLWNPLNLHRFIANIAYGGSLTAAYAAFKFLTAENPKDRAHYDWMGYTSFIIAITALLALPFAGYWLTKEMYDYSQQMGVTLMGGVFAWLFILQAVLIGVIFLAANYYLWCSLGRSEGSKRYTFMIQPLGIAVIFAFLVWFTPHTMVMTSKELSQIGGAYHPVLGPLGVMAAKNTAVNILILSTFCSFQIFRRSNIKVSDVGFWAKYGTPVQIGLYAAAIVNIIWLGIYSYYLPASIRIGLSVPQVVTTLVVLIVATVIDILMFKKSESHGPVRWGFMPVRSQYALFILAVSFTWLMGLMGYVRSAIRQHWHVYSVFRDNSPDAYTPTLPYAATMVTFIVIIFMALILFMFWMPILASKKEKTQEKTIAEPVTVPGG